MRGSCGPGSSRILPIGESEVTSGASNSAPAPASSIAARSPKCSAIQPPASPPSGAVDTVRQIMVAVTRPSSRSGVAAWRNDR